MIKFQISFKYALMNALEFSANKVFLKGVKASFKAYTTTYGSGGVDVICNKKDYRIIVDTFKNNGFLTFNRVYFYDNESLIDSKELVSNEKYKDLLDITLA